MEECHMSRSNSPRARLSRSRGALPPRRIAASQTRLSAARRLQQLVWLGLIVIATTAEAETWKPGPNDPLEKYDMPPAYIYRLGTSPRMILQAFSPATR